MNKQQTSANTTAAQPGGRPRWYNVDEFAGELRLSEMTIYRAIREDNLPALKIRGRYVISAKMLDRIEDIVMASSGVVDLAEIIASGALVMGARAA